MEILIALLFAAVIAAWVFRAGKRIGSRKGFGVGRSRGRRK